MVRGNGIMWAAVNKIRKKFDAVTERDVRRLDERKAVKYLMKKYETNREYTVHFLRHMIANHESNPQFDLYMESELGSLKRSRAFIKSLAKEFNNDALLVGKNCLDIGCSSGNSLVAFVESGAAHATGIEVCEGRFQTAKINIDGCSADKKGKINILREDIQNEAVIKLRQFDIIFCNDVLEHVKSPMQTVKHICKVLKNSAEAFAYINLRNYMNPENILHEPHYNLPGMVLLPHELAKQYYAACSKDNSLEYEVYHWMSFYDYQEMFESFGKKCEFYGRVNLDFSGIDHIEEKADRILNEFNAFSDRENLDRWLRREVEEHINNYLAKMRSFASDCRSANDEQLMKAFFLTYVIFNIDMLIRNKE